MISKDPRVAVAPQGHSWLGVVRVPGTRSEKREDAKARRREEKRQEIHESVYSILFLLRAFVPSRLRVKSIAVPSGSVTASSLATTNSAPSGRPLRAKRSAFTLIETMLAVLLMALLASAVAMSFSAPLKSARTADAIELIRSFDAMGRQAANASGKNVRLVFDLSNDTLVQRDGIDLHDPRTHESLPSGCHVDSVRIDESLTSAGEAMVDISPHGWSRSYAVHLQSPGADRWLVFAGLSGQMSQVQNESQIPTFSRSPRHNAD
jgi:type II secretory pathway pseudopilin PulG